MRKEHRPDLGAAATCLFAAGATLAASMASAQDATTDHVAALHRAVFELPIERPFPDVSAARELGLRYAEGRGVDRDPVMACSILRLAGTAAGHIHDDAAGAELETLVARHCDGLDSAARDEALQMMGCATLGLNKQTFGLEPAAWIEVNRLKVAVDRPAGRTEFALPGNFTCNHQYVLVKHTIVEAPAGSPLAPRHFLQLLSWTSGHGKDGVMRSLHWVLFEAATKIELRGAQFLALEPGSAWPAPQAPEVYRDGAVLTLRSDGFVRWRFPGGSAEGSIDPLPR